MIIGVGLDLVEISRISQSIERFGNRFLSRMYTYGEQAYCHSKPHPAVHYGARFAAKEACAKALGTGISGGIRFTDIEVIRDTTGKPTIHLTGKALEIARGTGVVKVHLSLTHTTDHASAVVILED